MNISKSITSWVTHDPWVCMRPSVRSFFRPLAVNENARQLLNHTIYFDQMLHTNACQHYLTTGMFNSLSDGRGFVEHHFSRKWSVSEDAHNS